MSGAPKSSTCRADGATRRCPCAPRPESSCWSWRRGEEKSWHRSGGVRPESNIPERLLVALGLGAWGRKPFRAVPLPLYRGNMLAPPTSFALHHPMPKPVIVFVALVALYVVITASGWNLPGLALTLLLLAGIVLAPSRAFQALAGRRGRGRRISAACRYCSCWRCRFRLFMGWPRSCSSKCASPGPRAPCPAARVTLERGAFPDLQSAPPSARSALQPLSLPISTPPSFSHKRSRLSHRRSRFSHRRSRFSIGSTRIYARLQSLSS